MSYFFRGGQPYSFRAYLSNLNRYADQHARVGNDWRAQQLHATRILNDAPDGSGANVQVEWSAGIAHTVACITVSGWTPSRDMSSEQVDSWLLYAGSYQAHVGGLDPSYDWAGNIAGLWNVASVLTLGQYEHRIVVDEASVQVGAVNVAPAASSSWIGQVAGQFDSVHSTIPEHDATTRINNTVADAIPGWSLLPRDLPVWAWMLIAGACAFVGFYVVRGGYRHVVKPALGAVRDIKKGVM
jgi:hypothetical protein